MEIREELVRLTDKFTDLEKKSFIDCGYPVESLIDYCINNHLININDTNLQKHSHEIKPNITFIVRYQKNKDDFFKLGIIKNLNNKIEF